MFEHRRYYINKHTTEVFLDLGKLYEVASSMPG